MKKTTLCLFAILILTAKIQSQSLLNGSFENTIGMCEYNISNATFNGLMSDCYGFGAPYLDIINSSCGFGIAQDGNYFVGICFTTTGLAEAFSLTLSTPLIIGETYSLSFYHRKDPDYSTNRIKVGYSTDSLSFGTLIDTVAPPDTTWNYEVVTFSPVNNGSYITVMPADSFFGWNHVDNFILTNTTNIYDMHVTTNTFSLFPNPANNILIIAPIESGTISILSLTGKTLMEKTFSVTERQFAIDISFLSSGLYFLKAENEVRKFVKK